MDGAPALKSSSQVHAGQAIVLAAPPRRYVSRGGEKLHHGLEVFGIDPTGRRCLDAGVSTGGFTDCLLQHGAAHVHAYDVGYGQVHERLRTHPRVTVNERVNIRDVTSEDLPRPLPDLLVADLSFISLVTVLPGLRQLIADDGDAVALVKPQFEAGRSDVGKGGVVRDPQVWRRCLERVAAAAPPVGWRLLGVRASPLLGPAGNVEFLAHLRATAPIGDDGDAGAAATADVTLLVGAAVEEGLAIRTAATTGGTA